MTGRKPLRGRFSRHLRDELEAEDPQIRLEGVPATLTLRNLRAPGVWSVASVDKRWLRCAVAVTPRRLVVAVRQGPIVNLPFADPRAAAVVIGVTGDSRLQIDVADLGWFDPRRSGSITLRIRTAHAQRIARLVSDAIASGG